MAIGGDGVVDLNDSPPASTSTLPPTNGQHDPLSSLSTLGSTIDSYSTDIPGFLNDLIAPLLPTLPPGAPAQPPPLAPIDKSLNDLLTRLSLLSQDTSSSLEQSIHDITRTVPRLTYDLQFMRESATSLQTSLSSVQSQVRSNPNSSTGSDEAKTFTSLEKLAHLDKLKVRMESARDILREAESWSTLESEITAFIEEGAWTKAGNRLAEAGRSMVVFQSTPGEYESRRTLLVSLQNDLEGALAKALEATIGVNDIEDIAKLRPVFEMIEREEEFKEYYFKARRKALVDEWSSAAILDITAVDAQEGSTAVKFHAFLPKFYSSLLEALQTEKSQIPLIFPPHSSTSVLSTFLQSTLDALSPSLQSRLGSLADYHGAAALPELIKAYKATEELAIAIQSIIDRMSFNLQGGVVSGSAIVSSPTTGSPSSAVEPKIPRLPHKRTTSRRFSRAPTTISEVPSSSPSEWETTLYEPFLDLQGSYPSLERRYLSNLLRTDTSLSSVATKGDASRALLDRTASAFAVADEAIARCLALTRGYGAKGLIDALGGFFEDFMESQKDRVLVANRSKSGKDSKDELDFDGLDYSTEDWGAFQLGLHVLSACREIGDRLGKFETRLHGSLLDVEQVSRIQPTDPSTFHLQETTLGAIVLLQQTPLNSADLHTILANLGSSSSTMLVPARDALSSFTRDAQLFLQNIILTPLRAQLDPYPNLPIWSQPDKASRRGDLQVPTFSLSPTDTIARVSEGLLNLLRVFEVYAADDALAYSIRTLPFVDADLVAEVATNGHGGNSNGGTSPTMGAETVLSTWVSSLSLSLLSRMTKSILPRIKQLSSGGAAQLASDLAYLSNAVRALDVEWDELERWKDASGTESEEEYRKKFREVRESGEGEDIWRRVGTLRGWA